MRLAPHARIKAEGLAIWLIVLAIIAGAIWFLFSARVDTQNDARAFAQEVIQKVVVEYDEKYIDLRLSQSARSKHTLMWRTRMLQYLRSFGQLSKPIETESEVLFTSHFFEPRGLFKSELVYPTTTARFDLVVSKGMTSWQIEEMNLIWNPPPAPSPTPGASATPTPTPTPSPAAPQKPKRKKGR